MKLTAYTQDTMTAIARKIDSMLDSIAELESGIMDLVEDDGYPLFQHVDNLRDSIDELCMLLTEGGS